MELMKKVKEPTLEGYELEAASLYLGMGNLAFPEKELLEIVKQHKDDFKRMSMVFNSLMGSWCESDEMYRGMLDEVDSFKKSLISKKTKDRKYWNEVWQKALAHD
jgi:hypothetical protein